MDKSSVAKKAWETRRGTLADLEKLQDRSVKMQWQKLRTEEQMNRLADLLENGPAKIRKLRDRQDKLYNDDNSLNKQMAQLYTKITGEEIPQDPEDYDWGFDVHYKVEQLLGKTRDDLANIAKRLLREQMAKNEEE